MFNLIKFLVIFSHRILEYTKLYLYYYWNYYFIFSISQIHIFQKSRSLYEQ